jgi:hypothetical protein
MQCGIHVVMWVYIRGVRRIGLTSLNPIVCLSSQSESDPKMKKQSDPIRENVYKIRSDAKFRNPIRT